MSQPYRCPVCNGRGTVKHDFYEADNRPDLMERECRSCQGTGVIYIYGGVPSGWIWVDEVCDHVWDRLKEKGLLENPGRLAPMIKKIGRPTKSTD